MKNKMKDLETDILICECSSSEHQIIFRYIKDEENPKYNTIYCNIFLANRNFLKRLISGIKYIFGYRCRYGHFEEFILSTKDTEKLQKIVNTLKYK